MTGTPAGAASASRDPAPTGPATTGPATSIPAASGPALSRLGSGPAARRLKRRRRAEQRFRLYGQAAIGVAVFMLLVLIGSIGSLAFSAFTHHKVTFDLPLRAEIVAPDGVDDAESIAENVSGFYVLVREQLATRFPEATQSAARTRELNALVTRLALLPVARATARDPARIGSQQTVEVALSDDLDLYLKGLAGDETVVRPGRIDTVEAGADGTFTLTLAPPSDGLEERIAANPGSTLIQQGTSVGRVTGADGPVLTGEMLTGGRLSGGSGAGAAPVVRLIALPEAERNVTDRQIAWTRSLAAEGRIARQFNGALFANADSTYPEIAGVLAALVGSILTMLMTAAFAVPVGIAAALYLEEFAPKNRVTELIEVNINNLAAVPSIIFGLLGAAVFLNVFGMPRSVPLVGGLVLGLLTLPTVIIAARAALRSVPPSIRSGALALGASPTQTVFHHVLPLAAPGILTGAIIGLARALGETAPLLLIGMVAFIAEVPSGPTDEATALPVLVYKWSTGAERAWEYNTAAAIIVLLVFMVLMNAAAVFLRRRFERTW